MHISPQFSYSHRMVPGSRPLVAEVDFERSTVGSRAREGEGDGQLRTIDIIRMCQDTSDFF